MDPADIAAAVSSFAIVKEAANKVLGPTFDLYGDELRKLNENYLSRRRQNVVRVFTAAERKLGDRIDDEGSVHPKVLKEILDDGSYAEDELAAEYFGGVLASSRTGVARDDRGAIFVKLVGRLSVYELRSHFVFYSLLRKIFAGNPIPSFTHETLRKFELFLSFDDYIQAMDLSTAEDLNAILSHAMHGLYREGLITAAEYASHDDLLKDWPEAPTGGILIQPSSPGISLFLWAHGVGYIGVADFFDETLSISSSVELPPIPSVQSRYQSPENA